MTIEAIKMMNSKHNIAISLVALFAVFYSAAISVSAFAPGMITSTHPAPSAVRADVESGMVRRDKPARTQEEDLELTRAIIIKHIELTEKTMVGCDDDDEMHDTILTKISTKVEAATDGIISIDRDIKMSEQTAKSEKVEEENVAIMNTNHLAQDEGITIERQSLKKIKSFGIQVKDDLKIRFGKAKDVGVALQPLNKIKSFGSKIKDDLKSRLGKAQ